jgi:hypothetical protein
LFSEHASGLSRDYEHGVTGNEMGFNKVFPYESTPQNGRNIVGMK